MRDLRKVIDEIITIVPSFEANFKDDILKLRKELCLVPPELMQPEWEVLGNIIKEYYIDQQGMIKDGLGLFVPRIISIYTKQDVDEVMMALLR